MAEICCPPSNAVRLPPGPRTCRAWWLAPRTRPRWRGVPVYLASSCAGAAGRQVPLGAARLPHPAAPGALKNEKSRRVVLNTHTMRPAGAGRRERVAAPLLTRSALSRVGSARLRDAAPAARPRPPEVYSLPVHNCTNGSRAAPVWQSEFTLPVTCTLSCQRSQSTPSCSS